MKLCLIYNSAAHYREGIFRLIDTEFDCNYFFGHSGGDIKQMDTSLLQGRVTFVRNHRYGKWYWQSNVVRQLFHGYDTYLILGETRCLSTWLICLMSRLFFPKKRLFFWSHGWYGKETSLERILKKVFFRLPNGGVFLYGIYARDLMIKEGFNPQKLYVIHNSLNYDQQMKMRIEMQPTNVYREHFGNNYPVLLMIGRLNLRKRLNLLVEAVAFLKNQQKMFNVILIGDGEDRGKLEDLVRERDLENQVWFYGACYDERINAELIYNADMCVVPGDIGLTAIHSMMFGTPCLTHKDLIHQGPEFEAIHIGKTGNFFEAGNVESLSHAIVQWFDERGDQREEIRKSCFQEIDLYWTPWFQLDVLKKHMYRQ